MGRHAALSGSVTQIEARKDAVPHCKSVTTAIRAARAVVSDNQAIVISKDFADAVRAVYIGGKVAEACEGVTDRLIELVATQLRRRRGLPTWNRADIGVVVGYLADHGQISLPKFLLAVAS